MTSKSGSRFRWLWLTGGVLAMFLGIIGIFIPLLPTTPFLLLAAWSFTKSSPRLHRFVTQNRFLSIYINSYTQGKGVPIGVKLFNMALLWGVVLYSIVFTDMLLAIKIFLLVMASAVTIHILMLKSRKQ